MATPTEEIPGIVNDLRQEHLNGTTQPVAFRKAQLKALRRLISENRADLRAAVTADLGRAEMETNIYEIDEMLAQVSYLLSTIDARVKPRRTPTPPAFLVYGRWEVVPEPYGVVLIIGPWNMPFNLVFNPLAGALAAGNTAVLKPSEVSPSCAKLMAHLVPRYLDPRAVRVVLGAVPETTALLEQRFDKICYTGSGGVGRIVATAAAKHLTPTLLELGGKNPTYVHKSADIASAARRIAWGRFLMCGQLCIGPDYVLVDREVLEPFVSALKAIAMEMFGDDPRASASYGRIVNTAHVGRLASYLKDDHGGTVVLGGTVDREARYVAPTIVVAPKEGCKLLTEEVFGPVLPVVPVGGGIDEVVTRVNSSDTPLAAYLFATDKRIQDAWVRRVAAGANTINDVVAHFLHKECPFGGKGASGMGAYRGAYSFDAFTHFKTVLHAYPAADLIIHRLRHAPYTPFKERWFGLLCSADLSFLVPAASVTTAAAAVALLLRFVDVKVSLR